MPWLVFTFFFLAMAFYLLLQNTPTQNQVDGGLQSELMPVHTSSPQTPPTEHTAQPPSTVDTAALSEDPLPGEGPCTPAHLWSRHLTRSLTNKQALNYFFVILQVKILRSPAGYSN